MRSAEEIFAIFDERRKASALVLERMREIRDLSNGDISVPLPEVSRSEQPAVANLIAEAIDQTSMRVSSTMPNLLCPAVDPRKRTGVRSQEFAEKRRGAIMGWWQHSRIKKVTRRRARFLTAYGVAPVMIRPDFKFGVPKWEVRDPLGTYPNPQGYWDDDSPIDCIFAFRKSYAWIKKLYPEAARRIKRPDDCQDWVLFELVEYVDADEIVLVLIGKSEQDEHPAFHTGSPAEKCIELERVPNRAGVCSAVTPKRITLDRLAGQFNQLTGMYQAQARLMALELIAAEKSVFPDVVLVPNAPNSTPTLVDGQWHDGREGLVNIIRGGDVKFLQPQPLVQSGQVQDRLERAQRIGGGAPPQWGGENPTNVRTGRGSEINMSAMVDFRIQEYQETIADAMVQENKRAVAVAKGYFGSQKKHFYIAMKNAHGQVDYTPNEHFETDENYVVYPMPGADVNGVVLGGGQRVGIGTLSRKSFMEMDPLVEDPEYEMDQIVSERMELALLGAIEQMSAAGQIPPGDIARMQQLVLQDNVPLADAVQRVQEEAQARQAEVVPPEDPAGQPGIAVPGTGAEAQMEQIQPPPDDLANLQQLLFGLRQPQGPSGGGAPEVAAGAGA